MSLDIDKERIKLIEVINDNQFNFLKFIKYNDISYSRPERNFLWHVLILTARYPQVESYLKNLLNYFTVNKLQIPYDNLKIFDCMCRQQSNISLNAFEIIIKHILNIKSTNGDTLAHKLFYNKCSRHTNNILNLLIKYGVDLNIINSNKKSVLDVLTNKQKELNEKTINCIMTIIDFGGRTNKPKKNNAIYDFIEYYRCSSIKPAIKNENKI